MHEETFSCQEALTYLYRLEAIGIIFGLENITALLKLLDNPEKDTRFIHIAGTNGKGSTASFISSVLVEAHYQVGLYTSPHLVHFNERIRIQGKPLPDNDLTALINILKRAVDKGLESGVLRYHPTYFEAATALAFLYFSQKAVDIAVIECGMGGRLDATNVITPCLSIITNIGLDHQEYLGNSLAEITQEKAAIIKSGIPVISGIKQPDLCQLIQEKVANQKSSLQCPLQEKTIQITEKDETGQTFQLQRADKQSLLFHTSLLGDHQPENAALAVACIELLQEQGFKVSDQELVAGISNACWPGRAQLLLKGDTPVLLDGAHNEAAVDRLIDLLQDQFSSYDLVLILGMMKDKDRSSLLNRLVGLSYKTILTRAKQPRSASPEVLYQDLTEENQQKSSCCQSLEEAIHTAFSEAKKQSLICLTGSLYIVGEALPLLDQGV